MTSATNDALLALPPSRALTPASSVALTGLRLWPHASLEQAVTSSRVVLADDGSLLRLALALGGGEMTPEELARLYLMLAGDGHLRPLRYVQEQPQASGPALLTPQAAFMVRDMLRRNPRPDGLPLALPNVQIKPDRPPPGLIRIDVCAASGELPNRWCPQTRKAWYIPGVSPIRVSNLHRPVLIDTRTGKAACPPFDPQYTREEVSECWPSDVQRLYRAAGLARRTPPNMMKNCQPNRISDQSEAPQIRSPLTQVSYQLRLSQPQESIALNANAVSDATTLYWFADQTLIGQGPTSVLNIRFTIYSNYHIFDFPYIGEAIMSAPIRVLFVCVANSARSQLAEALLKHSDTRFQVFSAGTEPTEVDPRTAVALAHVGVDTERMRSKSIDEFRNEHFDYVITLCDKSARECRAMPTAGEVIAWDVEDPVSSSHPDAFKHALHDIHERVKLFVLVKTKHLEAS